MQQTTRLRCTCSKQHPHDCTQLAKGLVRFILRACWRQAAVRKKHGRSNYKLPRELWRQTRRKLYKPLRRGCNMHALKRCVSTEDSSKVDLEIVLYCAQPTQGPHPHLTCVITHSCYLSFRTTTITLKAWQSRRPGPLTRPPGACQASSLGLGCQSFWHLPLLVPAQYPHHIGKALVMHSDVLYSLRL